MDRETEASPPSSGMLFVDWSPGDHGHGTIEIMVTAWWQLLIDIMVTAWWQLTIQIMVTAWWQLAIEIMVRQLTTETMEDSLHPDPVPWSESRTCSET